MRRRGGLILRLATHLPETCTQLSALTYVTPCSVPSGISLAPCPDAEHHATTSVPAFQI